ncbi:MAG: hypothetical protein K5920_08645 [Bacteroidales bacterium]|nr:hypothetical protein [Bacteroidales bacterium]
MKNNLNQEQMVSCYAAFKVMRERAEDGETPDLTMEEIDEEIQKARAAR